MQKSLQNEDVINELKNIAQEKTNIQIDTKDIQEALLKAKKVDTITLELKSEDAIRKVIDKFITTLHKKDKIQTIFIKFDIHPEVSFFNLSEGLEILDKNIESENLVFGTSCSKDYEKEYIRLSSFITYGGV